MSHYLILTLSKDKIQELERLLHVAEEDKIRCIEQVSYDMADKSRLNKNQRHIPSATRAFLTETRHQKR
jgi:hypothetical protein